MLYTKLYSKLSGKSEKTIYQDLFKKRKKYFLCAVYLSWMILFPELLEELELCTVSVLENGEWVESTIDQIDEEALTEIDYKLGLLEWAKVRK